jgi:hypothetical protein
MGRSTFFSFKLKNITFAVTIQELMLHHSEERQILA